MTDAQKRERRQLLMPDVVRLYAEKKGHKTIAKELGISPRIARVILIEAGAYRPGSLMWGEQHRKALSASRPKASDAEQREGKILRLCAARGLRCIRGLLRVCRPKKPRPSPGVYYKHRYHTDQQFRETAKLRKRLHKVIVRGDKYSASQLDWLGCSPLEFIEHIESLWVVGMSWSNYGMGDGKWCIDHKQPCCQFDMLDPKQRAACFHFTNLQPLWWRDNMSKGSKNENHNQQ